MTTSAPTERLVYHPPKAVSFGHASRVRNARKAWLATQRFLDEWTIHRLSPHVDLSCYGPQPDLDATIALARTNQARQIFGVETRPSDEPGKTRHWHLSADALPEAIAFALDDDKWAKQPYGPTRLAFSYRFQWLEWPSQDKASSLLVSLGARRAFLQPTFYFPGSYNEPGLRAFLSRLDDALPFRFRNQYFKRWIVSGKSKRGIVRNLGKDWR